MVEQFLTELGLSEAGARVFRALVAHDQAAEDLTRKGEALTALPKDDMRSRAHAKLEQKAAWHCYTEARDRLRSVTIFTRCQELNEDELERLTDRFYVAIREMGFWDDPDGIVVALRHQIDPAHVAGEDARALTLALPESSMPQVRQIIIGFLQGLIVLREEAERVYLVNLGVFPLTRLLEDADSPSPE